MGKRIIIFNLVYYAVILLFVKLGRDDASSSLGYGFFIISFWIVAAVVLIFFLVRKIIDPNTVWERIGIITATPVLSIITVWLILSFNEQSSEWTFNKGVYLYLQRRVYFHGTSKIKKIEYYRIDANSTESWGTNGLVWIYNIRSSLGGLNHFRYSLL